MPTKRSSMTKRTSSKRSMKGMRGRGIFSAVKGFLGKANQFLRKYKVLSRVSGVLGMVPSPYSGQLKVASALGSTLGYGKRRQRRLTGGALMPAGSGMCRRKR